MAGHNLMAEEKTNCIDTKQRVIYSEFLERDVIIDVYLPVLQENEQNVDLLLINDGQDLRTMDFASILDSLNGSQSIKQILCVGIHCGIDRMNEYGIAYRTDYLGRGSKAGVYSKFIFYELLPYIKAAFNIGSFKNKSFAGFSLGGLSALDIVWNYPHEFSTVGVFSGSLWWRRHAYDDEAYNGEKDRIMHLQVQKGTLWPQLKFFFQCGKLDETADRNNNGIIDSIEDTTDLIAVLRELGYGEDQLFYLELEDGRHNLETWKKAFPAFLKWGWETFET